MFEYHTDSKGNSTLIAMLSDSHLLNIIKYDCKLIKQAADTLSSTDNAVTKALLQIDNKELEKTIRNRHKLLYPYIMEASLRGLETTSILRDTYGRESAIKENPSAKTLCPEAEDAREWGLTYEDTFDYYND